MDPATFDLQPRLEDERVLLRPLRREDFEALYAVASDPLVWEQHPNKDRYKKDVFETFFSGAMESGGAFLAVEKKEGQVIGTSRFYDLNIPNDSVAIGYTFIGRPYWGHTYNRSMKRLMVDHAFRYVQNIFFHIGANNIRSQKAIGKIGAVKVAEKEMAYHGESKIHLNYIYQLRRS